MTPTKPRTGDTTSSRSSQVLLRQNVGNSLFLVACLILALQATAFRMLTIDERSLPVPGLHQLPLEFGNWKANSEETLDVSVTDYLKPDEYILRDYLDRDRGASINVFVAYFKSLQNTYGPHSPRVCLPGNGWLEGASSIRPVKLPGRADAIPVNQYVLEKAGNRILVFYWYQNNREVWAEEFRAKLRLLPDLIRYRRSDVSLVRLIAPMRGTRPESELANCLEFTRSVFPALAEKLGTVQ
jgi:EpsI family protein